MPTHKDSICGLEIRNGLITIAQYSPREKTVGSIVIKPFSGSDAETYDASLKIEMKKLISDIEFQDQPIVCSLPSEFAIIKKLSLDADEKDIGGAIAWELSQHVIGSIEEYSIDFEPLAGSGGRAVKNYLAVAYRATSVRKMVSLLKANKLHPFIVDLDLFALINVFEANYGEKLGSVSAIVQGTEEKSTIIFTRGGTLVDYEVFTYDPAALSADAYVAALNEYGAHLATGSSPEKPELFFAGSLFAQTEFADAVMGKFGKAEILNPFKKIACRAVKSQDDIHSFAPRLAVAVGLALRGAAGD